MDEKKVFIKGRGTPSKPQNRFENFSRFEASEEEAEQCSPRTQTIPDKSQSLLNENSSPDIPFRYSLNLYRGCEHGCAYCYARPTHEYLGFSAGLDFETKILVKEEAPRLLREALTAKKWQGEAIMLSGVTDCYQPLERRLELTRRCLETLVEFKNPFSIITKNHLVTRDLDLISEMAAFGASSVWLSVTTLDAHLCRVLEPRTSSPSYRLKAIETLAKAGIPVGVNVAPVIPGLTDVELPRILQAAREAGAQFAGYVPLRLPYGVAELFVDWVKQNRPEREKKILHQIKSMRGGRLNDPRFGTRMAGEGLFAQNIEQVFRLTARKLGFNEKDFELSSKHFKKAQKTNSQLDLFS